MKNILSTIFLLSSILFVTSCSDDHEDDLSGTGSMELYFDHSLNGDKLILNTSTHTNSLGETLKVSRFTYIISNIRLHKTDGTVFEYPKDASYFIVNSELNNIAIDLSNIPSGDYNKITFGVGVDQPKYLTGESEQQAFWDLAASQQMTWAWITGYKFINFEGTFTSANINNPTNFRVHMGSHGTALDNYREQTVTFPSIAKVRKNAEPSVHFVVDANKILDGEEKLKLAEALNPAGTTAIIMVNAEKAPKVANNAQKMFVVDHVHQGAHQH
ncbi:MAG: MbnP family protein [Flavobacterium sp.]